MPPQARALPEGALRRGPDAPLPSLPRPRLARNLILPPVFLAAGRTLRPTTMRDSIAIANRCRQQTRILVTDRVIASITNLWQLQAKRVPKASLSMVLTRPSQSHSPHPSLPIPRTCSLSFQGYRIDHQPMLIASERGAEGSSLHGSLPTFANVYACKCVCMRPNICHLHTTPAAAACCEHPRLHDRSSLPPPRRRNLYTGHTCIIKYIYIDMHMNRCHMSTRIHLYLQHTATGRCLLCTQTHILYEPTHLHSDVQHPT